MKFTFRTQNCPYFSSLLDFPFTFHRFPFTVQLLLQVCPLYFQARSIVSLLSGFQLPCVLPWLLYNLGVKPFKRGPTWLQSFLLSFESFKICQLYSSLQSFQLIGYFCLFVCLGFSPEFIVVIYVLYISLLGTYSSIPG